MSEYIKMVTRQGKASARVPVLAGLFPNIPDVCKPAEAAMSGDRAFAVKDEECVACNLCVNVCPVQTRVGMAAIEPGMVGPHTGKVVEPDCADWATHPNNPEAAE